MKQELGITLSQYNSILDDVKKIHEESLKEGTNDWNKTVLTSNFKIGKRIVEIKQDTKERASYGEKILEQLSKDLNNKYKKGFSESNLQYMRKFFIYYRNSKFYSELTWSHYISLLQIEDKKTRQRLERITIQKKTFYQRFINLSEKQNI